MSGLISSVSVLLHHMSYCHLSPTCCGFFRMGQSFVYVLLWLGGGEHLEEVSFHQSTC